MLFNEDKQCLLLLIRICSLLCTLFSDLERFTSGEMDDYVYTYSLVKGIILFHGEKMEVIVTLST